MIKTRLSLSIVVGLILILASPALAGFQEGLDTLKSGDYEAAMNEFRPLAEQGDALAQFLLGRMYDLAQGVPQDYQEAGRWFRLAAEQGHASAQFNLGYMHAEGQGVPQDDMVAHMWFSLAAAQGDFHAEQTRNKLEENMTLAQLAEAQRLAREWKAKGK